MEKQINTVQIDGLVLLKMLKHSHDEMLQSEEVVNGVLLGLAVNDVLEVTHSFPNINVPEGTDETDMFLSTYPTQMIRMLRDINVDYMEIGFYQSSTSGAFLNKISLENLFHYQCNLHESIMLIYDPSKTRRGQISLKAFQLSNEMRKIVAQTPNFNEPECKIDQVKLANLSNSGIWREIPVVIRNSHLINCLVGTINNELATTQSNYSCLDLGVSNSMEGHFKIMSDSIDTLCGNLQSILAHKRASNRGNKVNSNLPVMPDILETVLLAGEISQFSQDLCELTGQSMGKVMLTKGLQGEVKKLE